VKNPGTVYLRARVAAFPFGSIKCEVAIIKPSGATAASRVHHGWGHSAFLAYDVPASEAGSPDSWKARVTNLDRAKRYTLTVRFPGDKILKTLTVPANIVNTFVNNYIKQIKIRVTSGTNASYIDFPSSLGVQDIHFTVPNFSRSINLPWPIPDIRIRERANSINSRQVSAELLNPTTGFANGSMRLTATFEESGREILGTFDCQMRNMKITVDLGLEARDHKISYNRAHVPVNFTFNINVIGVPNWVERYVLDPIIGYSRAIEREVERRVRAVFESESTRRAISNAITNIVAPLLGANPRILSARIQGNQLKIRYYNA